MALTSTTKTKADQLYDDAVALADEGNFREASGLLWQCASAAWEDLAERRGWESSKNSRYSDYCAKVSHELPGEQLHRGYTAASLMERNWVENYELDDFWIRNCAESIRSLVDLLQSI